MKFDVYQTITDNIVRAIEAGAEGFKMPWHVSSTANLMPVNATTGKPIENSTWILSEKRPRPLALANSLT